MSVLLYLLSVAVLCLFLYLSQYLAREEELVELWIVGIQYLGLVSLPGELSTRKEQDVVTDVHHGVHVVGVDDCGYSKFLCDVVYKFVYDK